jgi:hypothetical protein
MMEDHPYHLEGLSAHLNGGDIEKPKSGRRSGSQSRAIKAGKPKPQGQQKAHSNKPHAIKLVGAGGEYKRGSQSQRTRPSRG